MCYSNKSVNAYCVCLKGREPMKKIEFDSLKIERAAHVIESRISNMVIKGTVKPGDKLPTEKELSNQFDVSVVTIREALRGLEVAGLIEKKRGKGGGVYVTEINSDSVITALHNYFIRMEFTAHHLAQVRFTLEPTIVRIVAGQITPEELAAIDENLTYCEKKLAKSPVNMQLRDYNSIGEHDLEFHRLIAAATHNPVFVLTVDYILEFIHDFKKSFFNPDIEMCSKVVSDHRSIYQSLKEGHVQEAEDRMISHLKYIEDYQMDERP
jgi:GntR family transcriptional regulator, transcriptional repressor for pyruvate dehydrogenase complex